MIERRLGRYKFGLARELNGDQLAKLTAHFERPQTPTDGSLGGRVSVSREDLEGVGPVVVKHYSRGGLVRHIVKRYYVRWGPTRSESEFRLLERVRALGVNAPEPIAHASDGALFYRAWLVTREIQGHRTLAEIARQDEDLAARLVDDVARQIGILIKSGIFHVDLHPGNVLVDREGRVFIVDFDKADEAGKPNLRDQYIVRWRRAVIKHHLPDLLSEAISLRLRCHE